MTASAPVYSTYPNSSSTISSIIGSYSTNVVLGPTGSIGPIGIPGTPGAWNPIYSAYVEFIMVTENDIIDEGVFINNISYQNSHSDGDDIIEVSFTFDDVGFRKFNPKEYLKDIIYVIHQVHDKIGVILKQFIITVEYVALETNWTMTSSDLLGVILTLRNIKSEDVSQFCNRDYIKSLQRDHKLGKIL